MDSIEKLIEWTKKNQWIWLLLGLAILALVVAFLASDNVKVVDKVDKLQKHSTDTYPTRNLDSVRYIVVHHSASKTHKAEDFARWHVEERDWAGIGYHEVIEKDGLVCITQRYKTRSNHVKNNNTASIGICLSGNFQYEEPTKAQLKSLDSRIKSIRKKFPQSLEVKGHKDLQPSTSCCGDYLYNYIKNKYS